MRCFVFWFVVGFIPSLFSPLQSQILVNEIYYDHVGADAGHEFVELINRDVSPVCLDGYALEFHDGNTVGWRTVWVAGPSDTIIGDGVFVVGGGDVWPTPERIVDLVLQNGPDALRLVAVGIEADRVGYGALQDPLYYEGESAPDVGEGWSLGRYPDGVDSDNNANDFRALPPSPGMFNRPRVNVALRLAPGFAANLAIDDGVTDEPAIDILNLGVERVPAASIAIGVVDSIDGLVSVLAATTNAVAIEPGDSSVVRFVTPVQTGYHHVTVTAIHDGDERPHDNTLVLVRRIGASPLIISEVMSYPAVGSPEYVEVFNTGVRPYAFVAHKLRDSTRDPVDIASPTANVAPGGYLVIAADKPSLLDHFGNVDSLIVVETDGAWPSLNQSGSGDADSVLVFDRFGLPLDRVSYPAQPTETRGRSLERVDLYPGVRAHVWVVSRALAGGSPGSGNPRGIYHVAAGNMSVEPNPFDPTHGEELFVTVPGFAAPTHAQAWVFDLDGRRMRALGASSALPVVFAWDGRDDRGRRLPSGFYVVVCELEPLSGGRRVERVVVGCGKRPR